MSEEHICTEECVGELEDIVARLQEEHQEDLRRIQHLDKALRLCAAGCDIAIQDQQASIAELEEALRRIHRECFDNLSAPGALKHRTLVRVMQECESVIETPNFGAALSPSEVKEDTDE